jgi:hypothetical protein
MEGVRVGEGAGDVFDSEEYDESGIEAEECTDVSGVGVEGWKSG